MLQSLTTASGVAVVLVLMLMRGEKVMVASIVSTKKATSRGIFVPSNGACVFFPLYETSQTKKCERSWATCKACQGADVALIAEGASLWYDVGDNLAHGHGLFLFTRRMP